MSDVAPELVLDPPIRDLGDGFQVRRALPSAKRRIVGPFVFLDQMGPVAFQAGQALDVRPHPHIGLATVTYLFEGEIMHRDSLGTALAIQPGAVNWMTAGRGIVHSERTPPERRRAGEKLFGIQAWVALPKQHEETDPAFAHVPAKDLPLIEEQGVRMRLIAGSLFGVSAPVPVFSPMFYLDASLNAGQRLGMPADYAERAVYIAEGRITVSGTEYEAGKLLIFPAGGTIALAAAAPSRLMLLGGDAMDGPRHIWWNFVSSSKERIEQAKADWRAQKFPPVPGESEFIPLPEDPPPKVRYP
jgi:redox-sensitive bicupin YhaK (pirin superfamily)